MGQADEIEVRSRFTGEWAGGFELHDVDTAGADPRFRVRRRSDGCVLPGWFAATEIRPPQSAREAINAMERYFLTDPDTHLPGPPRGMG